MVNCMLYGYANGFHILREYQEMTGEQRNCKNVPMRKHEIRTATKSARRHKEQEIIGKWRYLNNALHDFYPSAHSVTSSNEGPQEM